MFVRIGQQMALIILGSIVSAYGMTLAIHAGFGCATLAVLWQGLSVATGLTLGGASLVVAVVMLAIAWFWDSSQIGVGTILYQVVYSPLIDVFSGLHWYSDYAFLNCALMVVGVVLFALGTGVYSATRYGRGSYEAFSFAVAGRFKLGISRARILCDILVVVIGFLLGGTFGLCTICTILLSGPVIGATVKRVRKVLPEGV